MIQNKANGKDENTDIVEGSVIVHQQFKCMTKNNNLLH